MSFRALLTMVLAPILVLGPGAATAQSGERSVTALGRLEPKGGVIEVAGPSTGAVVISELRIEEGDSVKQGQILAVLDTYALSKAERSQLKAELDRIERQLQRTQQLYDRGTISDAKLEDVSFAARVARAKLATADAELEMSLVRAPAAARVLAVHARAGEQPGPEGIVELGRTDEMYAIAEVYETDITRVALGQRALISSPALAEEIQGSVEHIGLKIGKMDVLSTDPVAKADARVVEVKIRLDEEQEVAGLTNLQVQIEILP